MPSFIEIPENIEMFNQILLISFPLETSNLINEEDINEIRNLKNKELHRAVRGLSVSTLISKGNEIQKEFFYYQLKI